MIKETSTVSFYINEVEVGALFGLLKGLLELYRSGAQTNPKEIFVCKIDFNVWRRP